MSNTINSPLVSNYSYMLNHYYSKNRDAAKKIHRANMKDEVLVTADSHALSKVAKGLRDLDYTSDNGVGIYNNVKAFIETYNNFIGSSSGSLDRKISHTRKLLTKAVKENSEELEAVGITILSSGKLSLNKTELAKCSSSKVKKIFSEDSDLTKKIKFYAGKIYKESFKLNLSTPNEIPEQNNSPAQPANHIDVSL